MSLKPGLRPYAFVKFDTFIQRTKRLYLDPRGAEASGKGTVGGGGTGASAGLDQLNEDLQDVTRIMTKNMEDLLWRGDSLDRMSTMSSSLRDESLKYRKAARKIVRARSLPLSLSVSRGFPRACGSLCVLPRLSCACETDAGPLSARAQNIDAAIRKWAPIGVGALFFFVFIYYRFCESL